MKINRVESWHKSPFRYNQRLYKKTINSLDRHTLCEPLNEKKMKFRNYHILETRERERERTSLQKLKFSTRKIQRPNTKIS